MVETLSQRSADVLPLQPMDSHFIYQAVNLKAPNVPRPLDNTHTHAHTHGVSRFLQNIRRAIAQSHIHRLCRGSIKSRSKKRGPFIKWMSSKKRNSGREHRERE